MAKRAKYLIFWAWCFCEITAVLGFENGGQNGTVFLTDLTENHPQSKQQNVLQNSLFPLAASQKEIQLNECVEEEIISPLAEFPEYFTDEQLRQGFVVLHVIGVIYFFIILALVCNNYFLPTVECICDDLNLSKDVAAATFMATATTMPEFFTNTVSTLITDSDMGLGTIIGSLMFNTLGVAGLAALAIQKPVQLDWWPITRDCCIYTFNIVLLLILAWGGTITFTESLIMVVFLIVYYLITFYNGRLMPVMRVFFEDRLNCCLSTRYDLTEPPENSAKAKLPLDNHQQGDVDGLFVINVTAQCNNVSSVMPAEKVIISKETGIQNQTKLQSSSLSSPSPPNNLADTQHSLWTLPRGKTKLLKCWWGFTFPVELLLRCIIPDPLTRRRLYPLTFITCVLLIGLNAYMIVWMLTAIGVAIGVSEIVMGLTILAAGSAMPEAISSTIALRSGESGIGVSNSLGANSLAILLSLGVPWFIKNSIQYNENDGRNEIIVADHGISYNILILMLCTVALFIILSISGYRLSKRVGVALISVYLILIILQILIETNTFFPRKC